MSPTSDPPIPPGTRLAHYEVRREIGVGAMGTVYEAYDTSLDRAVAVKVLKPRIADDAAIVERFFREARAAARVNHPNLIHIYYVGTEGARPFFAMELIPGDTLEQAVERNGPFPLADAVDDLVEAARGLAAAHAAGVIHRDVKPSNLMRGPDGVVRVGDFGLAKSMDADVNATGGGSLMGTPTYMSPEQFRGAEVDVRSDVYALGLVAWFLLGGRAPFESKSLGQLLQDHMNSPLPSLASLRPDLPPTVDAVLAKLCAKDPRDRPKSMDEVISLLESLRPRPVVVAPLFTRAAAFMADFFAATLAAVLAGLLLFGIAQLIALIPFQLPGWARAVFGNTVFLLGPASAFAATLLLPEVWYGTTVGKVLFGLRVVRDDGNRPKMMPLVGRLLLRFPALVVLPLELFGTLSPFASIVGSGLQFLALVAGVVCYFLRDERTLSDVVTRTVVAYRPVRDPG